MYTKPSMHVVLVGDALCFRLRIGSMFINSIHVHVCTCTLKVASCTVNIVSIQGDMEYKFSSSVSTWFFRVKC